MVVSQMTIVIIHDTCVEHTSTVGLEDGNSASLSTPGTRSYVGAKTDCKLHFWVVLAIALMPGAELAADF